MSNWDAKTAEWYAEKYGEYATNRLGVQGLQPKGTVVDIGCGTGAALRQLVGFEVPLIGVDPVPRMVEIAQERSRGLPIAFRVGPASRLPVSDAEAALVLAFDSLAHWGDVDAGLAEVKRILAPGGEFVVLRDGGVGGDDGPVLRGHFGQVQEDRLSERAVRCRRWRCRVS